jgi:hypothetical protein
VDADGFANGVDTIVHQNGSDSGTAREVRRVGFLMRMIFETPVSLPLPSLGHSSHFGLGLFNPVT